MPQNFSWMPPPPGSLPSIFPAAWAWRGALHLCSHLPRFRACPRPGCFSVPRLGSWHRAWHWGIDERCCVPARVHTCTSNRQTFLIWIRPMHVCGGHGELTARPLPRCSAGSWAAVWAPGSLGTRVPPPGCRDPTCRPGASCLPPSPGPHVRGCLWQLNSRSPAGRLGVWASWPLGVKEPQ